MSADRRLLLIAFKFPPFAEVASRRWTKLCKHLAQQDVDIDVITVRWDPSDPTVMSDVSSPRISVHTTASLEPHRMRLRSYGTSFFGRVLGRAQGVLLFALARAGWRHEARWWGLTMLPVARRLIREKGIATVVVTGGPFFSNWWAAKLRADFPTLNLIQEFRDSWLNVPSIANGPLHRREAVRGWESAALDSASTVVTVTEGLTDMLAARTSRPVVTIRNGFDPDDFGEIPSRHPRDFTLLYAGNLAVGRDEPLRAFLSAVRSVRAEMPGLRIRFFGRFPWGMRAEIADLVESGTVEINARVSARRIAQEMDEAFACLQFNARDFGFALSTKIYEYAWAKRPILCINYGGQIDEMMRDMRLGWSVGADSAEDLVKALRSVHSAWEADPSMESAPVGLDEYSYPHLAAGYAHLLFDSNH